MIVKLKPCAGDNCNGALRHIWKNHQGNKYCKDCWISMNPQKKLKMQVPIAKISPALKKQLPLYDKLSTAFKAMHPYCQAKLPGCGSITTDVHHKKGRGIELCNVQFFLAVCRQCHTWIEEHPKESLEMGFTLSRLTI